MDALGELNLRWTRRVPCVLQTEAAECGLACLAMIAGYYGHHEDLRTLRQRHVLSLKGMNAIQLIEVAAQMGLTARALRAELASLHQVQTPAILHWNFNHFVVLQKISRGQLLVMDPAFGPRTMSFAQASDHFTGVVFELQPSIRFRPSPPPQRVDLSNILGRIKGLYSSLFKVILLALALEIFGLAGPFLSQWLIDDALVSGDRDLITVIVAAIVAVGAFRTAIDLVRSWLLMHISTSLNLQWAANVLRHLMALPLRFFEKRHLGDVLSRFGAVGAIQQTLTTTFVTAVLDGVMAATTIVMMMIYSVKLASVALCTVALYALSRVFRYQGLRRASEGQIVRQSRQQTQLMESVRGIQAIKLFNRESDRVNRYLKLAVDTANAQLQVLRITLAFQASNAALLVVEGGLVLWIGSRNVLDGTFTIGMLVAFVSYKDQFTTRLISLVDRFVELLMLRIQVDRLSDIVLTAPEASGHGGLEVANGPLSIEVRNVSFRYGDGEAWVLRNVNLSIAAGESVALVGPSGCGKTTLLRILLGLLDPDEGEVSLGGVPLRRVGVAGHRSLVGAVMQSDTLFAGSLADNIAFFDPHPDQSRIERCARIAQIDATIREMPMGYHSLVGDMGSALSGGQVQRILLARAIYKNPRILVMDEATSHLDLTVERKLLAHLAEMSITQIMVAHRPETIVNADRVIRLDLDPGAIRAIKTTTQACLGADVAL
jgi:ATP-binding cassette, subfamily B, bacterial CvaB/MchF/RaxB